MGTCVVGAAKSDTARQLDPPYLMINVHTFKDLILMQTFAHLGYLRKNN